MQDIKSSKVAGEDKLSGRFIKNCTNILVSSPWKLSISHGVFPSAFKVAKLKFILKKGRKNDPSNYRPIYLLQVISKIIEKIVHDQTNPFFLDENILYNYQSGFRASHSTNLCFSFLTENFFKRV